jgi:hypothetical protein
MSSVSDRVAELVRVALDEADDMSVPVSAVARKALRVARLRNDWEAQWWLTLEMSTVDERPHSAGKAFSVEVVAHLTREEYDAIGQRVVRKFMNGPRLISKDRWHAQGIPDTEPYIRTLEEQIAALTVPDGLHPVDLYQRSDDILTLKAKLNHSLMEARSVTGRWRNEIADYLSRTERELLFGQVNADVFERNRTWVDKQLAAIAPQALVQFAAAYRRHGEGDPEARAHALTSCRRVLKTLADALYPATNEEVEGVDGKTRKMTDDKYIARLCEFAAEKTRGSASRAVLVGQIKALGDRLGALNALSSKGVHDQVSADEVDQCLIQTYLAVGDLLRLANDRTAAIESHTRDSSPAH